MKKIATALVISGMFALPQAALALDSSFEAMSQQGKHQFYVWCTGKDDYTASQNGKDAKAAQAALAAKAGSRCWPVWQGLDN
ncbi:MAG: hypothetical protein ACPGGG_03750 [Parvibaculales bacterium]|jgi:hypothetical protein|nr:hypothetical protein [Alphaproteobacteria bacterium]